MSKIVENNVLFRIRNVENHLKVLDQMRIIFLIQAVPPCHCVMTACL